MTNVISLYDGEGYETPPADILARFEDDGPMRMVMVLGFDTAQEFCMAASTADLSALLTLLELSRRQVSAALERQHLNSNDTEE